MDWTYTNDAMVKVTNTFWVRRSSVQAVTDSGDVVVWLTNGEKIHLSRRDFSVQEVINTIFGDK